jgi:hypothetical protein
MLDLRPNCECCDRDLPPDAADAMICSFALSAPSAGIARRRLLVGAARIVAANWRLVPFAGPRNWRRILHPPSAC